MTDTRNPYCAAKRPHLHVVETTTPQPGQIILMRHGAYRATEGGGYEPARVAAPVAHANAGPAMPLHSAWIVDWGWTILIALGAVCIAAWWLA